MEKFGTARQTTDDNIIWCMRFAVWINKATDTHSEYVTMFPWQNWLRERAKILHFTYTVCLVYAMKCKWYSICIQIAKMTKTDVGTVWNGTVWSCLGLYRKDSSFISLFHDTSFWSAYLP